MVHSFASAHSFGGGMSAGLPRGAPASAQAPMVAISSSVSEMSSLKYWTPIFFSMNQGGISRRAVFCFIARAQGRAPS